MSLLNTLLQKCVKRKEIMDWKISDQISIVEQKVEEELWEREEFKRMMYKKYCATCTCKHDCKLIAYRHWTTKNVIVNDFGNDNVEIIYFEDPLYCIDENVNNEPPGRNYVNIDGILFPKDENLPNYKFLESMSNSARQSVDKYWGYAKSNRWDYFFTLTSSKAEVNDRYDDDEFKEIWALCRKKLQRFDANVKILLVLERHKKYDEYGRRALHAHGFIATEKQWTMTLALDPKSGKQMYSASGAPLFNFPFWDKGMATCAILPKDENELESQARVVGYLSKYMAKDNLDSVGYGKKRFYHTNNLEFKTKSVLSMDEMTLQENLGDDYYLYKEQSGKKYYRKKMGENSDL